MRTVYWEEFLAFKGENHNRDIALSIGVFDGVHKGHLSLIRKITSRKGMVPWIVTFKTNPSRILHPEKYSGDLMSRRDKLRKLSILGIEVAVIIDFSREFGTLKGAEFFSRIREHCGLNYLAVGQDFHCGHGMDTSAVRAKDLLEPQGVEVEIIPPVFQDGTRISSTRIRSLVRNGEFEHVKEMLGNPYRLDLEGIPVSGKNGLARLSKSGLLQVVPVKGSFPVNFQ